MRNKYNLYNKVTSLNDFSYNSILRSINISIVIPLYNEENTIGDLINRIPKHENLEIIIVDDGSKDRSVDIIKNLMKKRKLILIRHQFNQGYGKALLTGIKKASGDIIISMDSDGQHNPEEIPKLLIPILRKEADIVIGSRYLGRSNYPVPIYTRLGELVIEKILKILFKQTIKNNQGGFRAFNKTSLKILNNIKYKGMAFTTEILFKASLNGLRLKEVPVLINPRKHGHSYVNIVRILKSITNCIIEYSLKKKNIDINKFFLKKLTDKIYTKFKHLKIFN
ncbi:MAG: glycosyltransferase family 2 protein [Promethearchaeota archaeon]